MVRELLMAVDLGTSFVKSGVYDLNGECIAVASEAVHPKGRGSDTGQDEGC